MDKTILLRNIFFSITISLKDQVKLNKQSEQDCERSVRLNASQK
jgi:hypothetical protein